MPGLGPDIGNDLECKNQTGPLLTWTAIKLGRQAYMAPSPIHLYKVDPKHPFILISIAWTKLLNCNFFFLSLPLHITSLHSWDSFLRSMSNLMDMDTLSLCLVFLFLQHWHNHKQIGVTRGTQTSRHPYLHWLLRGSAPGVLVISIDSQTGHVLMVYALSP